jgi:hypothetical protein
MLQSIVRDSSSAQLSNIKEVIVLVLTSSENKKDSLVSQFGPQLLDIAIEQLLTK